MTSSNQNTYLDISPLRTLSPMFPSSHGTTTFVDPNNIPFINISSTNENPLTPVTPQPLPRRDPRTSNGTMPATRDDDEDEDEEIIPTVHTSASGRTIKKPISFSGYSVGTSDDSGRKVKKSVQSSGNIVGSSDNSIPKRGRPRRNPRPVPVRHDLALVPSCQDPRESVEIVLMTFDALRRRLLQQDEAKEAKDKNQRPDLKAGTILMTNNLRANIGKRMGSVTGVEIGDIFYFRMELCLVGLHAPIMGGIDYMTSTFENGDDTVATSIVSAGGYENEEGDADVLIYSGQGGNNNADQKLERGNLALERSLHRGTDIRVTRSAKDQTCATGKIYIYDGLYKVQESWVEKSKSGHKVFKYKLLRKPEQPEAMAIWKKSQKWKENPEGRTGMILPDISSGAENFPIHLVNEVDNEKGPKHFQYVTKLRCRKSSGSSKNSEGCRCTTVCLPGDDTCSCARANGGNLPYSSSGFLVSRKPVIYECAASCGCLINCRNRLTQKGISIQFEVFKTGSKGWGLRSLDPIRTGTYICEYTGELIERNEAVNDELEDDEYTFQATAADDKALKWNYGPELLGEPSVDSSSESLGPLPFVISAKNMGNMSRFMNHSCSPNVFWQPVLQEHSDQGYPHIMFFAMKHIPPMQELTYDYGVSGSDGFRRPKPCLCGSQKCRGLFG